MLEMPVIHITRISNDYVHCEAFLLRIITVSLQFGAGLAYIDPTCSSTWELCEYAGLVYLYEHVSDGIPVELDGTLEGDPVTLSPAVLIAMD